MKFPSLHQLGLDFLTVCKRFPLTVLFTVYGTVNALLLIDYNASSYTSEGYIKGVYLGLLGLCTSLSWKLYTESKTINRSIHILGNILLIALTVFLYYALNPFLFESDIYKIGVLLFLGHLLVSVSAFSKPEESNGFWQFNKLLFLRICTSFLFSAVLFAGLSFALLAISSLFNVKIDFEVYAKLWVAIAGLFNTNFFLAGIPKEISLLNVQQEYPKSLKIFTQYVLIPLSTIYLFILLAYEIKITLAWILPSGYVSSLILGFAVFGILSLLLVYPIRNLEENRWINWFTKWFYLLMLPLLVLLFLAIYKRVGDYGITEQRYVLIMLGVWLLMIVVYFLIRGTQNIRVIPVSLTILCIIILIGPWSISSLSRDSQLNQLKVLLEKKEMAQDELDRTRNIIVYLVDKHGLPALQPLVERDLQKIEKEVLAADTLSYTVRANLIDSAYAVLKPRLKNAEALEQRDGRFEPITFNSLSENVLDIDGSVKLVHIGNNLNYNYDKMVKKVNLDGTEIKIDINEKKDLILTSNTRKDSISSNQLFKALLKKRYVKDTIGYNTFNVPQEEMTLTKEFNGISVRVIYNTVSGNKYKSDDLQSIEAFLILRRKP